MLENNTKKHNALTIQQLFIGCETHRGRYKGLKPDGKTKIAWEEPQPLDWSQHLSGDMQGKSPVDLLSQKAKWLAVDVDLNLDPKKFCKDVFSKLGFEYFVFRTVSGRFRVVKFYDDWHNPEQLKKEAEELEKELDKIGYKCDEGSTVPSGWDFKEEKPGRWIYLPYHNIETYCYTPEGKPLTLKQFEYRAQYRTNPLIVASVGLSIGRHKSLWSAKLHNKVYPGNPIDLELLNENFAEGVEDFDQYLKHIEKTTEDPKWSLESYSKGLPTWIKEMVGTAPNIGTHFVSEVVNAMSDNYIYVRHRKEFYELSSKTWVDKEGLNDDWYHQNKGKPIVKDLLCNPNLIKVVQTLIHPGFPSSVIELGQGDIPGIAKGRYYNLYKPSHFKSMEGDCSKFFEYFKWAIDDDKVADSFFQFIALAFQHPGLKSHWSTLIISPPGLGKDLTSEIIGNALGNENVVLNCTFDKMTNDHSTLIQGKQLIFINELMLSGQRIEGKVLTNKLKPYITNETTVINPKFKQEEVIPNFVNIFLFSNDDKPLVLDKDDRRLFVVRVNRSKNELKEKIKEFLPFFKQMKKNPSIFIHAMKNYPIPSLDFFEGDAPFTEAKKDLIIDSAGDFYNLLDKALDERTFPFCSYEWDDAQGEGSTKSTWIYFGFINLDNFAMALRHHKKFQGKIYFDDNMIKTWIKQNHIPWPNGDQTKRALNNQSRPHIWLLEDREILIETKEIIVPIEGDGIMIFKDRIVKENITKKISQLTELELGKAFNKYSFSFKNSKEYESKLELQKGIDYKGPPFSDEKTFEEHF
jgi:hypothetical protein